MSALVLPQLPSRFDVLQSAAKERLWTFTSRVLAPFKWISVDERPDWQGDASIVGLGSISLIRMRHQGTRLHSFVPAVDSYYDVHLALRGGSRIDVDGQSLELGGLVGAMVSPRMRMEMLVDDGYDQFHVRIERAALERHLARALGRPVIAPLRFDARLDFGARSLANWTQAVGLLVDDLASQDSGALDERYAAWSDLLITKLLHAQPHNYSDELERRSGAPPIVRRVQRVMDHVLAQPEADFSLDELAGTAGVTPRQLQRDFREHLGSTPGQFIERVRLERAHEDLVSGTTETVSSIAHRWGFGHAPRFAAAYRERFGVSPSRVLRDHRQSS